MTTDNKKTDKTSTTTDQASETPARFTLKTGTCVQLDGIDVRLVADTDIESDQSNRDALAKHTGTTFEEYPKRVVSPDGIEKNVNSPDEEAAWTSGQKPTDQAVANTRRTGLEDVTVEDDAVHDRHRGGKKK